ncbi:P-loop containing nucleoside triphosphate hydrolase protein [Rhodotorula sp. JG-1b]|nr:P-loop containing nucleoside triphosphate hydrolase protein [Rhodotorula sp. JG-1b]
MDADAALVRRLSHIQHVLLVLSGKGGVGKSSISVQLALALLAHDPTLRVGLLDVDLTGPSLPRMLGMEGRDVLASDDGWVPVYLDASKARLGVLACMSIGFLLSSSRESVVWRGPKKNAMVKQFLAEVRWGELDWLIVDTPPGTSDEHISLLESLRPLLMPPSPSAPLAPPLPTLSALLVSTPQAVALLDVSKELSFVRRTRLPLLGLVENMSGYVCPHCGDIVGVFGTGGGEDFCRRDCEKRQPGMQLPEGEEEGEGCRFLGRVPIDPELVKLLDAAAQSQQPTGSAIDGGAGGGGGPARRKTLVERYEAIPSFPVVAQIAETVRTLVYQQVEREANEQGKRLVAVERRRRATS